MATKLGAAKQHNFKKVGSEWECTIRFANGVSGTGRGRNKALAQKAAVAEARGNGGSGAWVVVALIALATGVIIA